MPRVTPPQINFTRGQLSEKMQGRYDLDFYYAGTRQQLNFESDIEGTATFRLGSIFLGETLDNNPAFLYEFIFDEEENYALEFTDTKLRFWTVDGLVAGAPLTTPYLEAELPFLKLAQTADTVYITHPNHIPQKLVRTGANTFTIGNHVLTGTVPTKMDWSVADNRPSAVTIYEKRLAYAGSVNDTQTVFMSKSFLYDEFDPATGNADDGIEYTIGSERINKIYWMSPTSQFCALGTSGGVFKMSSGSQNDAIAPDTIKIVTAGTNGVSKIRPARSDDLILSVQEGAEIVNSFQFATETDGFTNVDRTVLSEDITRGGIAQVVFFNGKPSKLVCVLNNGDMAVLVWKPEQSVFGWYPMDTNGSFISATALPRPIGGDRLITCAKRTINSVVKYYIELSAPEYTLPKRQDFFTGDADVDEAAFRLDMYEAQKEYIHVDSSLTFNGLQRGLTAGASVSLSVAAEGLTANVTASASLFTANDVGGQIRDKNGNGWGTITVFNSATDVDMFINSTFDNLVNAAGDYYITADTISGLAHLEGEEVEVIVDGAANEKRTVTAGVITLSEDGKRQGSVVHVGLQYNGILKTMNIEGNEQSGASQAKRKIVTGANVRFLNTVGAFYGTDVYKLNDVAFQNTSNSTNRPPIPFTGYKRLQSNDRTEQDKAIVILQNRGLPCTIQQIIPELNTSN